MRRAWLGFLVVCFAAMILTGCGKRAVKQGDEPTKYQSQAGLEKLSRQAGQVTGATAPSGAKAAAGNPKVATAKNVTPVKKAGGMADVCKYFPKELVESAIGKPIVKAEASLIGSEVCAYYTAYSQTYDHTPYGDKPGGPHVVVVYDTKDFAKDRPINEKHGSVYTRDPSIGMDNYVVRNNVGKIWMTALAVGNDTYIRFKAIDKAVTGDDLVKIARKFAEKVKR